MSTLTGRTALVTGSTSGIGKAIALSLAEQGCRIMINGIDGPQALEAAREEMLAAGAQKVALSDHNLLEPVTAGDLIAMTRSTLGGLHILVNNAGIQHVAPVDSFTDGHWDRIIGLNLSAPFRLIRHALPVMRDGGWGRIINIASVHGLVASVNKSAYIAAKHGLVGLTKTVALETAAEPVTCNAICPGYVRSALLESQILDYAAVHNLELDEAAKSFLREKQPSENFVSPSDIGALALFLCSDAAAQITGAAFPIDGGWTAA
ncbi:MAG: 3-hydroxybutyrate dehydrogenase [Anderseniella sp.]|jgi:3-hydroxybutyrate dehydrogenase|nr:3-hydroxybutyrate dehydrogenase [Anderseniella sp.]